MFKYFTLAYGGGDVAVNPLHVNAITEFQYTKQSPKYIDLHMTNGEKITVKEDLEYVVESLAI